MKLTEWFPADVKPVHVGLYETDAVSRESYQYWNGVYWGLQGSKDDFWPEIAYNAFDKSVHQQVKWRGLANPPKATSAAPSTTSQKAEA